MNFRKILEKLEADLTLDFSRLRNLKMKYEFLTEDDIENGDFSEIFTVRNDVTGKDYDAYIVSVENSGIKIIEADDTDKSKFIGFSDLSSTLDRINLIEMMEIKNL